MPKIIYTLIVGILFFVSGLLMGNNIGNTISFIQQLGIIFVVIGTGLTFYCFGRYDERVIKT